MAKRLTEIAHDIVRGVLVPGDIAIDATAGNGHDTLMLAQSVGPTGHVYAFDIQPQALAATMTRVADHGNVTCHLRSHAEMTQVLPGTSVGRVGAVVFNLGYLPGGDHAVITNATSTIAAIVQARTLLRPGGVITVMVYPGHDGGAEASAIETLLCKDDWPHEWIRTAAATGPRLLLIPAPP